MSVQEITLSLPEALYDQIKQVAERLRKPIEVVLAEAVAAVAPVIDTAPEKMLSALAHLAYLNDAALWQAARGSIERAQRERLDALHDKQQREGLTAEERAEEEALTSLYRETILVRAQAAALLKQRGYDVTDLSQFTPIE
jgi:uncharacterized protein YnzC (UPF0291/DUF896 family)